MAAGALTHTGQEAQELVLGGDDADHGAGTLQRREHRPALEAPRIRQHHLLARAYD
jgi:hypothetical protein